MNDLHEVTAYVTNVLQDEHPSVERIDNAIAFAGEVIEERDALAADIEATRRTPTSNAPISRDQEYATRAVDADLQLLEDGVTRDAGITNPRLEDLRGHYGRKWWQRTRERLVKLREHEAARAAAAKTTRSYRYTGPRHKTFIGGRYLDTGEVVTLNATQAEAFRDRFEEVTEQPV